MANAPTRLEGAELGTIISVNGDATAGAVSVQSVIKRSGDYAFRVTNNGVAVASIVLALQFDTDGKPATAAGFLSVAASARIYVYVPAYPTVLSTFLTLENFAGTDRSVVRMTTAGLLVLDGITGTIPAVLNSWNRIDWLYNSASTGSVGLRLNGSQQFTGVTPTLNGTVGRVRLGKELAAGAYDFYFDDMRFEAAASVALLDYPPPGAVLPIDPDGDGGEDGQFAVVPPANQAWQSLQRPEDDLTFTGTNIGISGPGTAIRRQTVTLEPLPTTLPSCVQICGTARKETSTTASVRLIARSGGTNFDLTVTDVPDATSYCYYGNLRAISPFTSAPWTLVELNALEIGFWGQPSASSLSILRCSTSYLLIDVDIPAPPAGGGSASLPSGGSTPAPEPGPDVFCASVIFDPGGMQEFDLSSRLSLARPLRQERDILLRDYRASDADLEFRDTDELFIETNPFSFLRDPVTGEPNWFGKRVTVDLRMGQAVLTRFIGQVLEVQSLRGRGILRIADRFQAMFDRPLLANSVGRIVSTSGALGLGPAAGIVTNAPATGWYLGNLTLLNQSPATRNQATKCQTWTLTFTSDAIPDGIALPSFFITGSVTGFDGEGQYGVPGSFTSKSGQIAINTARPGDIREDARALPPADRTAPKNSTTSIRTVWRPTAGTTAVQAMRQLLLDWRGVGLDPSEIDGSLDALIGTAADQLLPAAEFIPTIARMSFDETLNLLAAVQAMALHLGCSFIEKANGDIGVASFMPRVVPEPPVLCHSADLMDLQIAHLPIYNEYTVEHAFSESNDKFTQGFASPEPTDNDSFERYDKIFPAPSTMQFRGYDASNLPWMQSIALALYDRYKDPRRIYAVRAKSERLAADLGDVFRIDSLVPTIGPRFTEPVSIDRNITGDLTAGLELVEVDSEIVSGECGGYLGLDTNQTGLDDECWGVF